MQLVWTDRNGNYPWDKDYEEEFIYRQPLLDRNANFKFREAKNVAVFTTRQWLEEKKPILRVVHDADGDWQFLTGDQMPEDIKIVALEQMTLRDPTLNDVFNLDYREEANRNFVGDKWIRNSSKDERLQPTLRTIAASPPKKPPIKKMLMGGFRLLFVETLGFVLFGLTE